MDRHINKWNDIGNPGMEPHKLFTGERKVFPLMMSAQFDIYFEVNVFQPLNHMQLLEDEL